MFASFPCSTTWPFWRASIRGRRARSTPRYSKALSKSGGKPRSQPNFGASGGAGFSAGSVGCFPRWKALIAVELRGLWWGKFLGWLGGLFSEGQVADFVIKKMDDALKEWNLAR